MGNRISATFGNTLAMSDEEKTFFLKFVGLKVNRELGQGAFGIVYEAEFTCKVKNLVKMTEEEANLELYPGPKKKSDEKPPEPAPEIKPEKPARQKTAEELDREAHALTEAEKTPQNVGDWISKLDNDMEGKKVALKWLKYDSKMEKMVRNEAETLDELQHPNIVNLRTAIWLGETRRIAIIMELSPFGSLQRWSDRHRPGYQRQCRGGQQKTRMQPDQFLRFWKGIVDAIKMVHLSGRVHRDLHGGNILVFPDPEQPADDFNVIGKISDFGVVKRVEGYFVNPNKHDEWIEGKGREKAKYTYMNDVFKDKTDLRQMMNTMIYCVCNGWLGYYYNEHQKALWDELMTYDCSELVDGVPHGKRELFWMGSSACHTGQVARGGEYKKYRKDDRK